MALFLIPKWRLKRHMKDRIHIIGLEPYLNLADSIILEISRLRDACILLAKHRSYREYPMKWVEQNLQSHSLQITQQQKFPVFYVHHFVHEQLQVCLGQLNFVPSSLVKRDLFEEIAKIENKWHSHLKTHSSILFDFYYVIEETHAN